MGLGYRYQVGLGEHNIYVDRLVPTKSNVLNGRIFFYRKKDPSHAHGPFEDQGRMLFQSDKHGESGLSREKAENHVQNQKFFYISAGP